MVYRKKSETSPSKTGHTSYLYTIWQFLLKSSEGGVWGIFFWADIEAKIDEDKSEKFISQETKID